MVCVALISSDNLEWERTLLWALTFKLIRKIIGGVDYKVCDRTQAPLNMSEMSKLNRFADRTMSLSCVVQGVRDFLKTVLDKIQTIPISVSSAILQQLLAAREVSVCLSVGPLGFCTSVYDRVPSLYVCVSQVVEYILDRNACLLPAYFAVTEIRKLYPEGQLSHWVWWFVCECV